MNKEKFNHLMQTNKQNRTNKADKINHEKQQEFYKWLIDNGLIKHIK